MRNRACSGVRNKSYLKAEEMIQMATFVLVMVFIKKPPPNLYTQSHINFQQKPLAKPKYLTLLVSY